MMARYSVLLILFTCNSVASDIPQGWRTNGTGVYPHAKPPVSWSKDKNVIWKTELPPSNAIPILVEDRIFVCAEPDVLVCLDRQNGKILWQRSNALREVMPKDKVEAIQKELKQAKGLEENRKQLQRQIGQIRKKLKNNEIDEKSAQAQEEALKASQQKLTAKIEGLALAQEWQLPRAHRTAGYTTPTPTTDGKRVWVGFGTGVVACYDLEGKRQWIKRVDQPATNFGSTASPVLVGDKLLIHMKNLTALNAKTGEQRWQSKAAHSYGTSLPVTVNGESYLLTPGAELYRLSDGKRIARGRNRLAYASPVIYGRTVYYIQQVSRAMELPTSLDADNERQELKSIWTKRLTGKRFFVSPIVHDGLLYTINNEQLLSVMKLSDGSIAYQKELDLGKGNVYPGISIAGKYLYVGSVNGTTLVIETGPKYKEVARNELEQFQSSPVFAGTRMYVRTQGHLYCIGVKEEQ